jgi:hypothetical protein
LYLLSALINILFGTLLPISSFSGDTKRFFYQMQQIKC